MQSVSHIKIDFLKETIDNPCFDQELHSKLDETLKTRLILMHLFFLSLHGD